MVSSVSTYNASADEPAKSHDNAGKTLLTPSTHIDAETIDILESTYIGPPLPSLNVEQPIETPSYANKHTAADDAAEGVNIEYDFKGKTRAVISGPLGTAEFKVNDPKSTNLLNTTAIGIEETPPTDDVVLPNSSEGVRKRHFSLGEREVSAASLISATTLGTRVSVVSIDNEASSPRSRHSRTIEFLKDRQGTDMSDSKFSTVSTYRQSMVSNYEPQKGDGLAGKMAIPPSPTASRSEQLY
ncbi:hypothetical protein HK405_003464, partial [Cladochytrium tenue]